MQNAYHLKHTAQWRHPPKRACDFSDTDDIAIQARVIAHLPADRTPKDAILTHSIRSWNHPPGAMLVSACRHWAK